MKTQCFLTAKIQIRSKGDGISVYAPSHGLHEVYFNKTSWKVNPPSTKDNLKKRIIFYVPFKSTFGKYVNKNSVELYLYLISQCRLKLWTGWKDRPVDSVERLMGKSDKNTSHLTDAWPRTQSVMPIPGFCQPRAAETPLVRHKVHCGIFFIATFVFL